MRPGPPVHALLPRASPPAAVTPCSAEGSQHLLLPHPPHARLRATSRCCWPQAALPQPQRSSHARALPRTGHWTIAPQARSASASSCSQSRIGRQRGVRAERGQRVGQLLRQEGGACGTTVTALSGEPLAFTTGRAFATLAASAGQHGQTGRDADVPLRSAHDHHGGPPHDANEASMTGRFTVMSTPMDHTAADRISATAERHPDSPSGHKPQQIATTPTTDSPCQQAAQPRPAGTFRSQPTQPLSRPQKTRLTGHRMNMPGAMSRTQGQSSMERHRTGLRRASQGRPARPTTVILDSVVQTVSWLCDNRSRILPPDTAGLTPDPRADWRSYEEESAGVNTSGEPADRPCRRQ